jgi:16S rRNA (cytidine1402-2'-O)-methyltransferase
VPIGLFPFRGSLPKLHEETFTGAAHEALAHFQKKEVKGEIVVVIDGKKE